MPRKVYEFTPFPPLAQLHKLFLPNTYTHRPFVDRAGTTVSPTPPHLFPRLSFQTSYVPEPNLLKDIRQLDNLVVWDMAW